MSIILFVMMLVSYSCSLSQLENLVQEIGVLEQKMKTTIGANGHPPLEVMDHIMGFDDMRMLKESQGYIKEFLRKEELPGLPEDDEDLLTGHRRTRRQAAPSSGSTYKTYAVDYTVPDRILSLPISETSLTSTSNVVDLQDDEGTITLPCFVNTASWPNKVMLFSGDGIKETVLPNDDSIPSPFSVAVTSIRSVRSSDKKKLFIFQTLYEDSSMVDGKNMRCLHVMYEYTYSSVDAVCCLAAYKTHTTSLSANMQVSSQPRSTGLLITDGIFFAIFNPDTLASEGLHLYFYSTTDSSLSLVTSSKSVSSVFFAHKVTTGLNDVAMYTIGSNHFLATAGESYCFIYKIKNFGSKSVLELDRKIQFSAKTVNFFANSYGNFIILVNSTGYGRTYLDLNGELYLMQDNYKFGLGEWTSQGLQTAGSSLLPEQELISLGNSEGFNFLQFSAPGLLLHSSTLNIPSSYGGSVTGLSIGRNSPDPGLGVVGDVSNSRYFVVYKEVKDHECWLHIFDIGIEEISMHHYTYLGDLASKIKVLDTNVAEDEKTLEELKGTLSLIPLDTDLENNELVLTAETLKLSGTTNVNSIEIILEHATNTIPTFSTIDYNDDNSDLAIAVTTSTTDSSSSDYIYKNSILKSGPSATTLNTVLGSISAPSVTAFKAEVNKLDTTTVKGKNNILGTDMTTFLTKTLKTVGPQTLSGTLVFQTIDVSDVSEFKIGHAVSETGQNIEAQKYIDTSKSNIFSSNVNFKNVHMESDATFETTLNNIALKDMLIKKDTEDAGSENPIVINGNKIFNRGLTADSSISIGTINTRDAVALLSGNIIYKEDANNPNFIQTISCDKFYFSNIKIKNSLSFPTYGKDVGIDVRKAVLDDIIVTDEDNGALSGANTFSNTVVFANLKPSTINSKNPAELLINGAVQDIQSKISGVKLVTGDIRVDNINNVNLEKDVARTDIANTFTAEISFSDAVAVSSSIGVATDKTIADVDVSELVEVSQSYTGTVTVTDTIIIDNSRIEVTSMDFDKTAEGYVFTNIPVGSAAFADEFLYKDTNQEMSGLAMVKSTQLNFEVLNLEKTLDRLNLVTGVVHTSGTETTDFDGITFGQETTFQDEIHIQDQDKVDRTNPLIGDVALTTLQEQIYCPADGTTKFEGVKTLKASITSESEVTSYFDVAVNTKFSANGKDFGGFTSRDVADLNAGNTFSGKMTFAHSNPQLTDVKVTTDFAVSTDYHITADDEDTVLLNGENIKDFDSKIVKLSSDASHTVTTPIEFALLTVSTSGVLGPNGIIDGENPVNYLDNHVLLDDDSDISVDLASPVIAFKKGVLIEPKPVANTYFAGYNLQTYVDSLLASGDSAVSGAKTFDAEKSLAVEGDATFGENLKPFEVDISVLSTTGLTKSKAQTIDVEYTIDSVSSIEKITVDKIDGVVMADICLVDAKCEISCPVGQSPCATFDKDVITNGGINIDGKLEGIDMSTVLTDLSSNNKVYHLNMLEVPNGDFSWTNDVAPVVMPENSVLSSSSNTVSDLYSNLVVKSERDWSSSSASENTIQDITANIKLKKSASFEDITITSKKINEGTSNEVNPEEIITDSATKAGLNVFKASKTFKAVKANTATVHQLKTVIEINDIVISDYRSKALVTDDESQPGNQDFVQTVTGTWTMPNGIKVENKLSVGGALDGVEVEDLVRVDTVDTRAIPAITFHEGATVSGKIVTTGTQFHTFINNFFINSIKVNDASTINQKLKFTGDVTIGTSEAPTATYITKLNGIPASTWVETGGKTARQTITAKKTFEQEKVDIQGNLISDNIDGIDLSSVYEDALKTGEDATISGPTITFMADTTIITEVLNAPLGSEFAKFNDLLETFVSNIGIFVNNLNLFYTTNIIDVLPSFLRELQVAKKLNLGQLGYMEKLDVPNYLTIAANEDMVATSVSAVEMDTNEYSLSFVTNTTNCDLTGDCLCQDSVIASTIAKMKGIQSDHKSFSFSLPSGVFTVISTVDSSSPTCNLAHETRGLIVSGILTDSVTVSMDLALLSTPMVGINLIPQDLSLLLAVGYITDVEMWELGNTVYLAVAFTHGVDTPQIQLYKLSIDTASLSWEVAGAITQNDKEKDIGEVSMLESVRFNTASHTVVHLFAGRAVTQSYWGQPMDDIWVYEMSLRLNDRSIAPGTSMTFKQAIAAPGLVGMEMIVHKEWAFTDPEVLLLIAANIKFSFGPDAATVSTFVYDTALEAQKYKAALLPDNVQVVGDALVKMVSVQVARHTIVFLAEPGKLYLYRYIPYQGLRLVDSVEAENIVDFTVYSELGSRGEDVMVYVLEEGLKSKLYTLHVSGTVPSVTLSFDHYQT